MNQQDTFKNSVKKVYRLLLVLFVMILVMASSVIYLMVDPDLSMLRSTGATSEYVAVVEDDYDKIENGVHIRTGLIEAEGLMEVVNNCTNCHSSKLVTQNRMNKDRWIATIRWMQETQNLWDLGGNEEIIVNYLVTNYPPSKKGRREVLTNIEWYDLQE